MDAKRIKLFNGDSAQVLRQLPENSIDSIVCDPPYGLSFMGKRWDYDVPSVDLWREVLRVLKPGGHLLAFGGTRTYHRLVVNIEDAGFEIRDQIQWLYGSGFPKSQDISKAIDKQAGAIGNRGKRFNAAGIGESNGGSKLRSDHPDYVPPEAVTEDAKRWQGFGTALKPANEPIVLARKPIEKGLTIADNVLKYGTGSLNIDGCRIGFASEADKEQTKVPLANIPNGEGGFMRVEGRRDAVYQPNDGGRWPANVLLDETAAEALDAQSGVSKSMAPKKSDNRTVVKAGDSLQLGKAGVHNPENSYSDAGGASRFFYVAKASKKERGTENNHPTVKPIKLMAYLCRLVTPPGGTVLDPFMGSGSTGLAALEEGFSFIGIELSAEYFDIAKARLKYTEEKTTTEKYPILEAPKVEPPKKEEPKPTTKKPFKLSVTIQDEDEF